MAAAVAVVAKSLSNREVQAPRQNVFHFEAVITRENQPYSVINTCLVAILFTSFASLKFIRSQVNNSILRS